MTNVSIVTVTHHRSEVLLKTALSSLQAQTCSDFEWVVVNDGCDVETRQAIEAFQKTNPGLAIQYSIFLVYRVQEKERCEFIYEAILH
jgi:glycosyltransferase involved in cell wall biosynthesis